MAELTLQQTGEAGIEVAYSAADEDGDSIPASPGVLVHVKNGGASDITVTVDAVQPCNQGFTHDQPVVVTAGEDRFIGPFAKRFYTSTNKVAWTYDAVDDVTVAALLVTTD